METRTDLTYAMIKPDGMPNMQKIISIIKNNNFTILHRNLFIFTKERAKAFYKNISDRPYYDEYIDFMCSDYVMGLVLQKENAVEEWRNLLGDTNPEKAESNTIRKLFGKSKAFNAAHGSDSNENAKIEIIKIFSDRYHSMYDPVDHYLTRTFDNNDAITIKTHLEKNGIIITDKTIMTKELSKKIEEVRTDLCITIDLWTGW